MARRAITAVLLLAAAIAGCGRKPDPRDAAASGTANRPGTLAALLPPAAADSLCDSEPGAFLAARLRGAIDADVEWRGKSLQCEGGLRPDRRGVRAAFAGELPAANGDAPHRVRFIFGIDLDDTASGSAQALPTNLTVILEGEQTLYSTRGDDRCAAEITAREPAAHAATGLDRISVRGYCIVPAEDAAGSSRLLVPTFEFTSIIRTGEDP
jgi:hypothetical protein